MSNALFAKIKKITGRLREERFSPFLVGIVAIFVVWSLGGLWLFFLTRPIKPVVNPVESNFSGSTGSSTITEIAVRHPLDGMPVAAEYKFSTYAVLIDNLKEARPQFGVTSARLIFEVPVEGGVTRFMAIYDAHDSVAKIGPVRSVRPYFIDYASEFGAILMHVGGSPDALDKLNKTSAVWNWDEFAHSASFFRATDRSAPHNVYTSSDLTSIIGAIRSSLPPTIETWQYRNETLLADRKSKTGVLIKNLPNGGVEWRYDAEKNNYLRLDWQNGQGVADGQNIQAKNIAVVVTTGKVLDDKGRLAIKTLGSGKTLVFQEGSVIEGTWKKESAMKRLRFYDAAGVEITMIPGQTWVEVVTSASAVEKLTK